MRDVTNDFIEDVLSNEELNGLDEDANHCLVNNDDNQDADIQIIAIGTASSNSVESDHGCRWRIYFENAVDNVTLT